ncbi:hypothetical protein M8J76_009122 [Diaphorina citri]|nr:hypothetical protein M8J76_009122 [Diaphorina citri]
MPTPPGRNDNTRRRISCESKSRVPEQCPSFVSPLADSYNPHVRYGAAMALGIACAGTGLKEALALLEPMTNDPVSFVRQGALIASAMILVQQTEALCPKVKDFRSLYSKVISDKHEDVLSKFGAILAQGIIDAGGRNVTISLQSRTGHTNMLSVVGTLLFTQYWYWFPLSHCLALAFTPTCLIGLNSDLKMPQMEFKSASKPSVFAYPPPLEEKKREEREKVTTAVLSAAARLKKKGKMNEEKMIVDEEKVAKEEKEKEKEKEQKEKEEKKPEPNFEILQNPARLKVISMADGSLYAPVKELGIGGIVMMKRTQEGEDTLVEPVAAFGPKPDDDKEPEPPEPFEYLED